MTTGQSPTHPTRNFGLSREGEATRAVYRVASAESDVKPVSADGVCGLRSAATGPLKWSGVMPIFRSAELALCSTSPGLVGITMRSAY